MGADNRDLFARYLDAALDAAQGFTSTEEVPPDDDGALTHEQRVAILLGQRDGQGMRRFHDMSPMVRPALLAEVARLCGEATADGHGHPGFEPASCPTCSEMLHEGGASHDHAAALIAARAEEREGLLGALEAWEAEQATDAGGRLLCAAQDLLDWIASQRKGAPRRLSALDVVERVERWYRNEGDADQDCGNVLALAETIRRELTGGAS